MDNITIRTAIMKRVPEGCEIYFISPPARAIVGPCKKIVWIIYAKVRGINQPVEIHADMPETAIISHNELLTTMVSEIYDELVKVRDGRKNLSLSPHSCFRKPLSEEAKKAFDSQDINYIIPGAALVDPTGKRTDEKGNPKKGLILPK